MTAPQTRDADATRARILEAAFGLFVQKGFAGTAMREIAEASGVTKSLIHHHFGSKEALWEDVKEQAFAAYVEEQVAELNQASRPDRRLLHDGVVKYFSYLRDNPSVVRLLAWSHIEGDSSCGRIDRDLMQLGTERVRQGQLAGEVRADVNPAHVVCTFIHACTHWFEAASHHAEWPGVGSDDEFLDDFLKIFLDGLRPQSAR